MDKIKFHGLEMNLLEAKLYLENIKSGNITLKLSEEERIRYNSMNEATRMENEKKKARGDNQLYKEFNEKEYLELLLSIPIVVKDHYNKIEACKKKGHLGEKVLGCDSLGKALCYCHKCGDMYDRPMNMEEQRDFNKLMKTPMTI